MNLTLKPSHSRKIAISLVSFFLVSFYSVSINAQVLRAEQNDSHLRWLFKVPKDQLYVSKQGNSVTIETLNIDYFDKIVKSIERDKINLRYIKKLSADKTGYPKESAKIKIDLVDDTVELFSFFKESTGDFVVDFWINEDKVAQKVSALQRKQKVSELKQRVKTAKKIQKKSLAKTAPQRTKKSVEKSRTKKKKVGVARFKQRDVRTQDKGKYRDFRYGGALIWDYKPLLPTFKEVLNLKNKTPEFFYPIEDVEYDKDEKHAHMQLTINLYRERKWGLMYKSIKLYEKKYGNDSFHDLNEYLKGNALLRSTFNTNNQGIRKSAINIFINILESTPNYQMRRAIYKYQIQYHLNFGDFVQALTFSKRLYVDSMENFDEETSVWAAHSMLHNLAVLKQFRKIEELLVDKTIEKLLPKQIGLAYLTYVALDKGDNQRVIDLYRDNREKLAKPIHKAIIFNSAEAFFRVGEYEAAIPLFDTFIERNSYMSSASVARVRIALAYEVLEKDPEKVMELYMNAVNRSSDNYAKYEARIRYVGMRIARNRKLNSKDLEYRVLLARDDDENKIIDKNILKLLWLVRLRTFISNKELQKAITYLTSLPWHNFKPVEKRTFEADAAEVVYGLIKQHYDAAKYAEAVKVWEIYKGKYIAKVAMNPYLNFIVCNSYLKLGLQESFSRTLNAFKKMKGSVIRTFPIWIERREVGDVQEMVAELEIIRLINESQFEAARQRLEQVARSKKKLLKHDYYRGLLAFKNQMYKTAKKSFDDLFMQSDRIELTSEEVSKLVLGYVETLYQLDDEGKFFESAKAILEDIKNSKNVFLVQAKERILYLLIETHAARESSSSAEMMSYIEQMKQRYPKSPYIPRISYLEAKGHLERNEMDKGEELLRKIVANEEYPNYLKEMAKTELTSIMIKKRSL